MKLLGRVLHTASFAIPSLVSLVLLGVEAQAQKPSYVAVLAPLITDQKTVIPGHVLAPGNYSVRIIDRLRDRFIVQVNDVSGNSLATFIGVRNPEFDSSMAHNQEGPIFWSHAPKGQAAVRGFSFSNGNTLEFVYPKLEAVTLAKLNIDTVPAIDPESEGRKPDPKLSPEDREVVTLWMLSPTRVGPKDNTPAIAAKRYVAPLNTQDTPEATAPVQVASAAPAPVVQPRRVRSAPVQIAKAEPAEAPRVHTPVRKLPQTASNLPLLLLLCVLSLFTAAALRFSRTRA